MASAWLIVLAGVLVVCAGFLVSMETAIGRVSRSRIEELRKEKLKASDRLLALLEDRARYVNVLLFLSTLATVGATVIASYVCVDVLAVGHNWSVGGALLVALAIMVVISYVALGVAPRTLGRQHADRIALRSAGLIRALATILGPITSLLIVLGNALTPGKGYREGPFASQAELRELVDLAEADDLIEDDERQMIHSVFELGDTFAREVMVPRTEMVVIERTKTLRQGLSLGLRSGFSRIPVIGENADDIVGVIYLKDLVRRVFDHREAEDGERVESLMRPVFFVPDSKAVDELLKDMQAARVHLAIAVDEYGGTAGLVTIEDILEEIVGEIADEYDTEMPEVTELEAGSYRISSRMHVDDVAELLNIEIDADEEGIDTVLGLMAKRLGRVAISGSSITEEGYIFTAEASGGRRNRISAIRVDPVAKPEESEEA